jgi:hypothetical protein
VCKLCCKENAWRKWYTDCAEILEKDPNNVKIYLTGNRFIQNHAQVLKYLNNVEKTQGWSTSVLKTDGVCFSENLVSTCKSIALQLLTSSHSVNLKISQLICFIKCLNYFPIYLSSHSSTYLMNNISVNLVLLFPIITQAEIHGLRRK